MQATMSSNSGPWKRSMFVAALIVSCCRSQYAGCDANGPNVTFVVSICGIDRPIRRLFGDEIGDYAPRVGEDGHECQNPRIRQMSNPTPREGGNLQVGLDMVRTMAVT
jgi:hypothetical protein